MSKKSLPFIFFYGLTYMGIATFNTYINIYYQGVGYTNTQIGFLASIGAVVSLVVLPFWGLVSDRTNKKRVLLVTLGVSAAVSLLYPMYSAYIYICLVVLLYTAFNNAVGPLGDAMTLQFVKNYPSVKFSNIRLVGTISYAVMAAIVGRLLAGNVGQIFYMNSVILGAAFLFVLWMPKDDVEEKEKKEADKKANIWLLFQNKMLICIFAVSFVLGLTMTFYHSFIGLLLTEMGASTGEVGIATFLAAAFEIPVLFFVEKVFGKRKPVHILMFVGLAMGLRMFLLSVGTSVIAVYAASVLHGFNFILPYYFTVILIEKYAPEGLKATSQTVYTVFRGSVAALVGNLGGGWLSDQFSLQQVYLVLAVMSFTLLFVVPGVGAGVYHFRKIKKGPTP